MAIKLKEPLDVEVKQPTSQAQQTVDQTPAQGTQSTSTGGARTATTSSPATASAKNSTGFVSSPALEQAYALLQQQQANKPGNYTPIWQDEADAYLSQYENRGPFAYDVTKDALYNQYKDMYVNQGQLASMDVMGQAAAMTGGYGNSYVQSVGQQAYNQYLSQLNAVVPELHQMAHDRYTQEGQQMLNMYDLYLNRENQEYAKHQDSLDRWYQEIARLQSDYDSQYAKEYAKYRDDVADQQWQKSFKKSSSSGTTTAKYDKEIAKMQEDLVKQGYDITVDGIWGSETEKAYNDSLRKTTPDETGVTPSRQVDIENWLATAIANANGPSFDPIKLIRGSSYLTTQEEKEYAYAVLDAMK